MTATAPAVGDRRGEVRAISGHGHSVGIEEVSKERMEQIREEASAMGCETLEQLEECVARADPADLPVFDATIVFGDEMLAHHENARFVSFVEQQVYDLVVHKGFMFQQHASAEVKFAVPPEAWALKVPAVMHLHPSRTCCRMFQVLVVITQDAAPEIQVPHQALVPRLLYWPFEEEEAEESEGEELSAEQAAHLHMDAQKDWPTNVRPQYPILDKQMWRI